MLVERILTTTNRKSDRVAINQLPIPEPLRLPTDDVCTRSFDSWEQTVKKCDKKMAPLIQALD